MRKLKTRANSDRQIWVRRDRRRASPRMTRGPYLPHDNPPDADPTGDWRAWWHWGCGSVDGKPRCPPGHKYVIERYQRAAHRAAKVMGRRIERRKNKRIPDE